MGDVIKEVLHVVWSDIYYDQAASLVDFLLEHGTGPAWCSHARLQYIKTCLRDMAEMDYGEDIWDYGERSVRLSLRADVESDIYRLMSEYASYGFSFDDADCHYSLGLIDLADAKRQVREADVLYRDFCHDKARRKRRARENDAAACLERYLENCRRTDAPATMDGYARACGSRRIGRKVWRKYMT